MKVLILRWFIIVKIQCEMIPIQRSIKGNNRMYTKCLATHVQRKCVKQLIDKLFGHKWKLLCEVKHLDSQVMWPWEKKIVNWSEESHHFHSKLKIEKLLLLLILWVYQVPILSIENTKAPRVKFLEWVIVFF